MKQFFYLLTVFALLYAVLMIAGCPATLDMVSFSKQITDQNNNTYKVDVEVNNRTYAADFTVGIKEKEYTCGVNFEKAKDAPFSIYTDFSMYDLTGSFIVGYKGVLTMCGVYNREEVEQIILASPLIHELLNAKVVKDVDVKIPLKIIEEEVADEEEVKEEDKKEGEADADTLPGKEGEGK